MAVTLTDIGLQSYTSGTPCLVESVDYEQKVDEIVVPSCDSGFGFAATYDPMIEFSIKGKGDLPALLLIGTDGSTDADITGVNDGAGTETRIITSVKTSEENEGLNSWEISGSYYPGTV